MNEKESNDMEKGFAIGAVVMTVISLLVFFTNEVGMKRKGYTPSTWSVSTPEPVEVVAESFVVDDMGTLIFRNGDETERAFACGNWTEVKCLSH